MGESIPTQRSGRPLVLPKVVLRGGSLVEREMEEVNPSPDPSAGSSAKLDKKAHDDLPMYIPFPTKSRTTISLSAMVSRDLSLCTEYQSPTLLDQSEARRKRNQAVQSGQMRM
jgi:hypothetical protein